MKTTRYFWSYLGQFFLEWEMFQTKVVEQLKTHILCSIFLFLRNRAVYEITWDKYRRAGRTTYDNMAHAHCMLDTSGYKYTLKLLNAYCFSTATAARTRLSVRLYVHCLVALKWRYVKKPLQFLPRLSNNSQKDFPVVVRTIGAKIFTVCWRHTQQIF
jgi:hypothetical protein